MSLEFCGVCNGEIRVPLDVTVGDIFICTECDAELQAIGTDPVRFSSGPEGSTYQDELYCVKLKQPYLEEYYKSQRKSLSRAARGTSRQ